MKKQCKATGLILGLLVCGIGVSACGGGGGSSASLAAAGRPTPSPIPTAGRATYSVRVIIGFSGTRQTQTVPAGSGTGRAALPPGAADGGAVAGARIIYPDGSLQIADSAGMFVPSLSTYAQKNQKLLQTNPQAQPLVIVTDPAGKARPSTARVAAYVSAPIAVASVLRTTKGALASINNLAGVALLQATSSILSTDFLDLDVQGSDTHDNVVDLSTANIIYPSTTPAGGTIVQIPGSSAAYYFPPALPAGSLTDNITVTVTVPGGPSGAPSFTATNNVVVVAASSAVAVTGTTRAADGTPMPGAVALFAQLSRYFAPNYWFAGADDQGAYTGAVPQGQRYSLEIGAPMPFSPTGSFDFFVGSSAPDGSVTSFGSGSNPAASLDIFLPPNPIVFNNAPTQALPPFVGFVRDAWYNTVDATSFRVFDAQSGLQPLLAQVPSSFPSPLSPAPVGSGELATWCYQWQQTGGAATLVVVEATGPNCTQPGNDGFTVTPGPSAGAYSYVKYASNTTYPIGGTLDVATNAMLVESGSWTQSLTGSPSAPSSFTASVQSALYDAANQTFGSPVYNDTLQYSYALQGSGLSVEQFTNDTRTSAIDQSIVAVYNATKTQTAPRSSCAATRAQCYSMSGTVAESFDPSSGSFQVNYAVASTLNGDGSAVMTYQTSGNPADLSKVVIPLAPDVKQNASPFCLVCAGASGLVYDVDGTTKIGSFTVNNARLVQFLILDPANGGAPVDSLGFIL